MLKKGTFIVVASAILLMAAGPASAAKGVLACVGRHLEGTVSGTFLLSNLNDDATLRIDAVRVHPMDGSLVCTGPAGWGIKSMLGPNEATWLNVPRLTDWCGENNVPGDIGWVILKIHWSSTSGSRQNRVSPLYGRVTEVMRDGAGAIVARNSLECESVEYSPR